MLKKTVLPLALAVSLALARAAPARGAEFIPNTLILEQEIEVTADAVNIRSGPGESFPITTTAAKGDVLQVLGMLGNWYVVCLPHGAVGVVAAAHTRVSKLGDSYLPEGGGDMAPSPVDDSEAARLFALTCAERSANGLPAFAWDERLNKVAQVKAADMILHGYFGHDSPGYGTPFQMLKKLDVPYKSASENIVAASSVDSAHYAVMNRPAYRAGVLNAHFGKMGVGVANSEEYGKIVVQIFIQE